MSELTITVKQELEREGRIWRFSFALYSNMNKMEIFLFALWVEIASLESAKLPVEKRRPPVPLPASLTIHLDKVFFRNIRRLALVSRMRERFASSHLGLGSIA